VGSNLTGQQFRISRAKPVPSKIGQAVSITPGPTQLPPKATIVFLLKSRKKKKLDRVVITI